MWQDLIQWLEKHQMPCQYKEYLGMPCPGCGIQSAFIALLKGEWRESIALFPALIPLGLMLGFLVLHLFIGFRNGGVFLKILFIFNVALIVLHYFSHFI